MVVRWLYIIVFAFPIHHKITHSLPCSPLQILNLSIAAWRNPLGLIRITIFPVIPTLTHYFDILSDLLAGSIYIYVAGSRHRFSDILSDILSGILSDILFDIYFAILSGILPGTHSDILFDRLSGILLWHSFWHSVSGILSDICSDILFANLSASILTLCSGPGVAYCTRSPRYGSDWFMPTVTTSWHWRRRRRRTTKRKRRRSFTWQAAGTTNSLVEDPRGSSSGHWTIKRVRSKYQAKL